MLKEEVEILYRLEQPPALHGRVAGLDAQVPGYAARLYRLKDVLKSLLDGLTLFLTELLAVEIVEIIAVDDDEPPVRLVEVENFLAVAVAA